MRIIVYPHDLGIGGSQLNAIELAAGVRDLGHEVIVFGRAGALNRRIEELGLEFIEAPPPGKRPSPTTARALKKLVDERDVDVIHGYEWPPILDGVFATATGRGAAVVGTVMSMSVPPFIPRSVPLVVGTEEIAAAERKAGRARTEVIEPPVDLSFNDPESTSGVEEFCSLHGIDRTRLNVVAVARFARELKLEGTLTAIDVIGRLSESHAVRLVLVGDGPARDEVEERAHAVNAQYGSGTVVLTGQIDDPRPAYAVADVALGMGGSALRSLAYGAPLIVQGESGFWRALTPETVDQFLWTGWYGIGDGASTGAAALEREILPLLGDNASDERVRRGAYGREVVERRFALTRAALTQAAIYQKAIDRPASAAPLAEGIALVEYAAYFVQKRAKRLIGRESVDDFNSKPVTAQNARGRVR